MCDKEMFAGLSDAAVMNIELQLTQQLIEKEMFPEEGDGSLEITHIEANYGKVDKGSYALPVYRVFYCYELADCKLRRSHTYITMKTFEGRDTIEDVTVVDDEKVIL